MSSSSSSSATTTDSLLVNYNDAVIYSSDLFILDSSTAWLNDACINFQLTRLQHQQREERNVVCVYNEQQQQYDGITVQQQYLFLDPSVVSFLMHQLTEDYEDYIDELLNLNVTWNLLLPQQKTTTYSIIPNDDTTTTTNNKQQHTNRGEKKKNIVIIPISDQFGQSRTQFTRPGGGNHWSILLWSVVHQQQQQQHHDDERCHITTTTTPSSKVDVRYYHFDSCQGTNCKAAQMVAHKLHKVLYANHDAINDNVDTGNLVSVIECQTPQQRNGYDCGVLALGFAEALTNTTDRVEDDNLNAKKKKYYESLLQSYFDKHGGHEYFALRLREQIGDAIRELVPLTQRIT